jgi:hypothetical protein
MAVKTLEKQAKINEAEGIRQHAFDSIELALLGAKITRDEAARWIDLILRCRSLADMKRLKRVINTMSGVDV